MCVCIYNFLGLYKVTCMFSIFICIVCCYNVSKVNHLILVNKFMGLSLNISYLKFCV